MISIHLEKLILLDIWFSVWVFLILGFFRKPCCLIQGYSIFMCCLFCLCESYWRRIKSNLVDAAYVGLATIAGFIWWFVYADSGPRLPYRELVRIHYMLGLLLLVSLLEWEYFFDLWLPLFSWCKPYWKSWIFKSLSFCV